MKKLLLLLFIPVLFACSSDDGHEQSFLIQPSDIIGSTWHIESKTIDGDPDELSDCEVHNYIEIKEGSYIHHSYNRVYAEECHHSEIERTYELGGNKMDVGVFTGRIISGLFIDKNTLELRTVVLDKPSFTITETYIR